MIKPIRVLKETFITSLPLAAIMIIVTVFIAPFENYFDYVRLAVGYTGVVIGQSMFLIGLDISILPIGKVMGESLVKFKKFAFIIFFGLLFGTLATIAEPALAVLARQSNLILDIIHPMVFIWTVGFGNGIFVGYALYRIIKHTNMKVVFAVFYILTFITLFFVPEEFIPLAFDGSGASTGDMSVPFVLALGVGAAKSFNKKNNNNEDTFGLIGISSLGPIFAVFIYGIILYNIHGGIPPAGVYAPGESPENFFYIVINNIGDVSMSIFPLIIAFVPFQLYLIKLSKGKFKNILLGMIPTFFGLLIFLSSIDFGFAFAGQYIGEIFLDPARPDWFRWLLLIVGFVLGAAITLTEPAVTVLGEELEQMAGFKSMFTRLSLAFGIGLSAVLFITKILTQTPILYFLVPLYIISLVMMKFTPTLFVGLAFDSGGVAGGALTSALLTPLTLGVAQGVAIVYGENAQSILINGFGMIAFVSVAPLISVQLMGIIYKIKENKQKNNIE